jgi:hypothetical protein
MLGVRTVTFTVEKVGNTPQEWEDGARADAGDPGGDRNARFAVADGATEGYDSIRWAEELVTSFTDQDGGPLELTPIAVQRWLEDVQRVWVTGAPPTFANVFEKRKLAEGSFATFLGCELRDAGAAASSWQGVALGDTVLFQVRRRSLLVQFPALAAGDFGLNPGGVHTAPAALPQMAEWTRFGEHVVQARDLLFLVTDALAEWTVRARDDEGHVRVWTFLSRLAHPDGFRRVVQDRRAAGAMRNDDVTLMRILLTETDPGCVMVCL